MHRYDAFGLAPFVDVEEATSRGFRTRGRFKNQLVLSLAKQRIPCRLPAGLKAEMLRPLKRPQNDNTVSP